MRGVTWAKAVLSKYASLTWQKVQSLPIAEANIPIVSKKVSTGMPLRICTLLKTSSLSGTRSAAAWGAGACAATPICTDRHVNPARTATRKRGMARSLPYCATLQPLLAEVFAMKRLLMLMVVGALLVAARPARAHHSFAAEFDVNQPITLKGTLTKMDWVNPHGWIYVEVKGADGQVSNWAIEAGGPTQLVKRGVRNTDFPPGIGVTDKGVRAR